MNFEDIKNKVKEALGKHPDKAEGGVDKSGDYVKDHHGHDQQVDSATEKAKGYIGDDNTGDDNTGDDNTGDDNTGDDNTGDDNTGNR